MEILQSRVGVSVHYIVAKHLHWESTLRAVGNHPVTVFPSSSLHESTHHIRMYGFLKAVENPATI